MPHEKQIELDIRRTFPNNPYFKCDNNLSKLKRILLAYSSRNLSIGYCQGFNFIVGKLLIIVDSEVNFKFEIGRSILDFRSNYRKFFTSRFLFRIIRSIINNENNFPSLKNPFTYDGESFKQIRL